jgi:hypothetical protein
MRMFVGSRSDSITMRLTPSPPVNSIRPIHNESGACAHGEKRVQTYLTIVSGLIWRELRSRALPTHYPAAQVPSRHVVWSAALLRKLKHNPCSQTFHMDFHRTEERSDPLALSVARPPILLLHMQVFPLVIPKKG